MQCYTSPTSYMEEHLVKTSDRTALQLKQLFNWNTPQDGRCVSSVYVVKCAQVLFMSAQLFRTVQYAVNTPSHLHTSPDIYTHTCLHRQNIPYSSSYTPFWSTCRMGFSPYLPPLNTLANQNGSSMRQFQKLCWSFASVVWSSLGYNPYRQF